MNTQQHFGFALILVIISYFVLDFLNLTNYLRYTITLFIGAVIPDWIEPALDYKHRKYFHSRRMLKNLCFLLIPSFILGSFFSWFFYLFSFVVGYISHLLLDSRTTMGLPK